MGTVIIPNRPAGSDVRSIGQILADFDAITNELNGNLDDANYKTGAMSPSKLARGITFAGKSIISAEENRINAAYGMMPTQDRVQNVVLPTDGLMLIGYQCTWKCSNPNGLGAIFLDANQLKYASPGNADPIVDEAANTQVDTYMPMATCTGFGLVSGNSAVAYNGDVATGQILGQSGGAVPGMGGMLAVFAASGTYTVSVQFKSAAGSVTVKNRKLWVAVMGC